MSKQGPGLRVGLRDDKSISFRLLIPSVVPLCSRLQTRQGKIHSPYARSKKSGVFSARALNPALSRSMQPLPC